MTTIHNVNVRFAPAGMNFVGDLILLGNVGLMVDHEASMNREHDCVVEASYLYRQSKVFAFCLHDADFSYNLGIQNKIKEHLHAALAI